MCLQQFPIVFFVSCSQFFVIHRIAVKTSVQLNLSSFCRYCLTCEWKTPFQNFFHPQMDAHIARFNSNRRTWGQIPKCHMEKRGHVFISTMCSAITHCAEPAMPYCTMYYPLHYVSWFAHVAIWSREDMYNLDSLKLEYLGSNGYFMTLEWSRTTGNSSSVPLLLATLLGTLKVTLVCKGIRKIDSELFSNCDQNHCYNLLRL